MNLKRKLTLSAALVVGIAIGGTGFCSNHSNHLLASESPQEAVRAPVIRRSVIKVYTDHGVIALPGDAATWDQVENAVFVADSIADVQMVNNEVPWRISYE